MYTKISSLARVMAKKTLKNVLLEKMSIFDDFYRITLARDNIFVNCFFPGWEGFKKKRKKSVEFSTLWSDPPPKCGKKNYHL